MSELSKSTTEGPNEALIRIHWLKDEPKPWMEAVVATILVILEALVNMIFWF